MAKTTTVEKNFTGSSQTGDAIYLYGNFSLSISIGSGTWTAGNVVIQRSTDDRFWVVCIKYPEQDDYRQWIFGNSYEPLEKLANKVNGRLR